MPQRGGRWRRRRGRSLTFALDSSALILGVLTGVFIYWGWESAVNLNEETTDSNSSPGLAAIASTVILLLTYVLTTVAVVA